MSGNVNLGSSADRWEIVDKENSKIAKRNKDGSVETFHVKTAIGKTWKEVLTQDPLKKLVALLNAEPEKARGAGGDRPLIVPLEKSKFQIVPVQNVRTQKSNEKIGAIVKRELPQVPPRAAARPNQPIAKPLMPQSSNAGPATTSEFLDAVTKGYGSLIKQVQTDKKFVPDDKTLLNALEIALSKKDSAIIRDLIQLIGTVKDSSTSIVEPFLVGKMAEGRWDLVESMIKNCRKPNEAPPKVIVDALEKIIKRDIKENKGANVEKLLSFGISSNEVVYQFVAKAIKEERLDDVKLFKEFFHAK